jgi:hypothetical protein
MSRYDYIKIQDELLPVNALQRRDLSGLEFQTKSLDREFLEYQIGPDGELKYTDYEYELVETNNSVFKYKLRKKNLTVKDSDYTGEVLFYGKPYDTFYIFKANFSEGKMKSIERIIK